MSTPTTGTLDSFSPVEKSSIKRAEKREDTRSRIATIFIFGYLFVIGVLILLSTFFKLPPENAKDYLLAIGSPLGFIIGYYFKSASSD